jgi:hypothetical protein
LGWIEHNYACGNRRISITPNGQKWRIRHEAYPPVMENGLPAG